MRRQAIALRLRLSGEELAQRSRAICDRLLTHFPQLAAMRVGFCWPMKNEPDLLPLLTETMPDTERAMLHKLIAVLAFTQQRQQTLFGVAD